MGSKISIDKHVSSLEDILDMNPYHFNKIKFENKIPESIIQHIKIWRFFEEDKKSKSVRSEPISLQNIQSSNFTFLSSECYLLLLVYKTGLEDPSSFVNFPHSMWGMVESYSNLTPRGLETPISSSQSISSLNKEVLESFLVPKRSKKTQDNGKFEYMLFVWNGKTAGPLIKSIALSTAFDFESFIEKAKDPLLQVLFSGGVIRNKKLQRGTILQLNSASSKDFNAEIEKKFTSIRQTVYLFKFLFPMPAAEEDRKVAFKNFNQYFLKKEDHSPEKYDSPPNSNGKKDLSANSSDIDQDNTYEIKAAEPMTHRQTQQVPSLSLAMSSKGSGQQHDPADKGQKSGKFMIPNLNLGKNLNQNERTEEEPRMRTGFDPHNTENKHDPNKPNVDQNKPKAREENKPDPAKGKFSINLANVNANRFGNESARLDRRDVPSLNQPAETKAGPERQIAEHKIEERSHETEENSEEMREENSSEDSSYRMEEPAQRRDLDFGNLQDRKDIDKLSWEQLAEADNEEIEQMRESAVRDIKIRHFSQICNEIIPDFLYLGGEPSALNLENLEKIGITHIINTAADVVENKFPSKFKYLSFYQKDSKTECIECLFYDCFDFLEKCRNEKGKALVHCVQGISRSVSVSMAYVMLKQNCTYDEALDRIKKARGVANPNVGFVLQLLFFQKRLLEPFKSIPGAARVFCIGSHQPETPHYIVSRMIIEQFYQTKYPKKLDPRTVFIVQTEKTIFKWLGNKIFESNIEAYEKAADLHIKRLQQFERGAKDVVTIKCGEEPEVFWSIWGNTVSEPKYLESKEWNPWFIDLSKAKDVTGITYKRYEDEDPDEEEMKRAKPNFFVYPSYNPIRIFDFDELSPDALVIVLKETGQQKYCYYWRGTEFAPEEEQVDEETYYNEVLSKHWHTTPQNIKRIEEKPGNESSEFEDIFNYM